MKRVEVFYNPKDASIVVSKDSTTTEAIGVLQIAIDYLIRTERDIAEKKGTEIKPNNSQQIEVFDKMPVYVALSDSMARRLLKHEKRPQTMGDIARIPSYEFLRLNGVGSSTVEKARRYFEQYGFIWK